MWIFLAGGSRELKSHTPLPSQLPREVEVISLFFFSSSFFVGFASQPIPFWVVDQPLPSLSFPSLIRTPFFSLFWKVRSVSDVFFLGPTCTVVSCLPPNLGRLCAEPRRRAQRNTPRVCRIPFAVAAAPRRACRAFLPEPRAAPIDGRGRPQAHVAPRAFLYRP